MDTTSRRHDIDALRALAFGLLILYHCGMLYVADWPWHLKSGTTFDWLQWPMMAVNRWRMDLVFLVSGIATACVMPRRSTRDFLGRRCVQLLLPLVFGMLVIVPLQPYVQGVRNGLIEPGVLRFLGRYYAGYAWPRGAFDGWEFGITWNHLWYIAYLWAYTLVLAALRPLLERLRPHALALRGARLLVLPAVPLLVASIALQQAFPSTHNLVRDWFNHATYFCVFVYGWWLGTDAALWNELARMRRGALAAALAAGAVYFALMALRHGTPSQAFLVLMWALRSLYAWLMLAALLGWSFALLNRPWRWLPWARESVYPWYLLHQSLILLIAYWIVPQRLPLALEATLVVGGTLAGCWLLNDGLIRRMNLLRVCFGLNVSPGRLAATPEGLQCEPGKPGSRIGR